MEIAIAGVCEKSYERMLVYTTAVEEGIANPSLYHASPTRLLITSTPSRDYTLKLRMFR